MPWFWKRFVGMDFDYVSGREKLGDRRNVPQQIRPGAGSGPRRLAITHLLNFSI